MKHKEENITVSRYLSQVAADSRRLLIQINSIQLLKAKASLACLNTTGQQNSEYKQKPETFVTKNISPCLILRVDVQISFYRDYAESNCRYKRSAQRRRKCCVQSSFSEPKERRTSVHVNAVNAPFQAPFCPNSS